MRHKLSEQEKFTCHDCGELFSYRRSLHRHIEDMHRNQRNFECDICHRIYNRRDNLWRHVREVHKNSTRQSEERSDRRDVDKKSTRQSEERSDRRDVDKKSTRHTEEHPDRREGHEDSERPNVPGGRPELRQGRSERRTPRTSVGSRIRQADVEVQVDVSPDTREAVESGPIARPSGKPLSLLRNQVKVPRDSSETSRDSSEGSQESSESDSESEQEAQPEPKRVKIGKDIGEFAVENVLSGSLVNVVERSSSTLYYGSSQWATEIKKRTYRMVVLKTADNIGDSQSNGTNLHHVEGDALGKEMSKDELQKALIGNVKEVREVINRRFFSNGQLCLDETTTKDFVVDLLAGTQNSQP